MPFNVIDSNREHVGIIVGTNPIFPRSMLVALTDERISDYHIDLKKAAQEWGSLQGSTSFFGRIKEDKLKQALQQVWTDKYRDAHGYFEQSFMLRMEMVTGAISISDFVKVDLSRVRGYISLSREAIAFDDRFDVVVEGSSQLDYFQAEAAEALGEPALHCKVVNYPVVSLRLKGFFDGGKITDFGGWDHIHSTEVILQSGNVTSTMTFENRLLIPKKGMPIALLLGDGEIRRFFCDGVIYALGE